MGPRHMPTSPCPLTGQHCPPKPLHSFVHSLTHLFSAHNGWGAPSALSCLLGAHGLCGQVRYERGRVKPGFRDARSAPRVRRAVRSPDVCQPGLGSNPISATHQLPSALQLGSRESQLPGPWGTESVDELPGIWRAAQRCHRTKGTLGIQTAWGAGQGGVTPGAACLPQLQSSRETPPCTRLVRSEDRACGSTGLRGTPLCLSPRLGRCPFPLGWPR